MNTTFYRREETSDLKDLLWRLASQWKLILLTALIMAVLVCGAKHMSDVQRHKERLEAQEKNQQQQSLSKEERISSVLDSLPDEEVATVEYMLREQRWLNNQKEYIRESLFMKTDPTDQRELVLVYQLNADNNGDLPALVRDYYSFLSSDELAELLKQQIAPDAQNKAIRELLSVEGQKEGEVSLDIEGSGAAMCITVILPEETDAAEVEKTITSAFKDYSGELQTKHPHTLAFSSSEETRRYEPYNITRKTSAFNGINSMEKTLKDGKGNLSESQLEAFETISAIELEPVSSDDQDAADSLADNNKGEERKIGYSKKYALLGLILGGFLYVAAYVLLLMSRGCINSAVEAADTTGARLLGEVRYRDKDGLLYKLASSKLVDKIRYKGGSDTSQQIGDIVSSLEAVCENKGIKKISLLSFAGDSAGATKSVDELAAGLKMAGISAETENVADRIDEKSLIRKSDILLIISDATKKKVIKEAVDLCKMYNIDSVGSVFIREV